MKIALVVAMDSEYRNLVAALGGETHGRMANSEVFLAQSGIGKVNAAIGTMRLVDEVHPDCIISTGLAGGIADSVDVWDAVVAQQTAYHDVFCGMGCEPGQVQGLPTRFDSFGPMVEHIVGSAEAGDAKHRMHKGLICTGDQFITSAEPVREILRKFPDALACDMESAAIAHTCRLCNVPFVSIRIVSDTPLRTHDHATQWAEALARMSDQSFTIVKNLLLTLPEKF